jgi:hypothetical protein
MKLWAISDLHLAVQANRAALRDLPARPADWLIVAGDVCESLPLFAEAMAFLATRFAARRAGVDTPEDPYPRWQGGPVVAPLFTTFDYSFRPPGVSRETVLRWAAETRCVGADERLIRPAPHSRMDEWCAELCAAAEQRLAREVPPGAGTVLVSHYPLRRDLVHIPRIPRFSPWCGSIRTEDWHVRFRAVVAVSGHLHVRRTDRRDGTRFEEVSLGYARQWDAGRGLAGYLRDVTPGR